MRGTPRGGRGRFTSPKVEAGPVESDVSGVNPDDMRPDTPARNTPASQGSAAPRQERSTPADHPACCPPRIRIPKERQRIVMAATMPTVTGRSRLGMWKAVRLRRLPPERMTGSARGDHRPTRDACRATFAGGGRGHVLAAPIRTGRPSDPVSATRNLASGIPVGYRPSRGVSGLRTASRAAPEAGRPCPGSPGRTCQSIALPENGPVSFAHRSEGLFEA